MHSDGDKEGQYYCLPWDRRVGGTIQLYLTHMLVKTTDKGGQDWDTTLPYVLFTFCCSMQSYTMKSLFFLLYWHDPRLPTETALTAPIPRAEIDIVTYKKKVVQGYTKTWGLAQSHVCKTQDRIRAILNREDSIDWLPTTSTELWRRLQRHKRGDVEYTYTG